MVKGAFECKMILFVQKFENFFSFKDWVRAVLFNPNTQKLPLGTSKNNSADGFSCPCHRCLGDCWHFIEIFSGVWVAGDAGEDWDSAEADWGIGRPGTFGLMLSALFSRYHQTLSKKKKVKQKIIADRAYKGEDGPCTEGGRSRGWLSSEKVN